MIIIKNKNIRNLFFVLSGFSFILFAIHIIIGEGFFDYSLPKTAVEYLIIVLLVLIFSLAISIFIVKFFSKTLFNLEEINQLNIKNRVALRASAVGIWVWDYKNSILTWDEEMYEIYGEQKESKHNPYTIWTQAIDKRELEKVETSLENAIKNNIEYDISFWITTPSGERRYIKALGINEYDASGSVVRMIGTNQNITQHQLMIEKVSKNEKRLSMFVELSKRAYKLTQEELVNDALDIAVEITNSQIGYLHTLNDDQNHISLVAWNKEALKHCTAVHDSHYPIENAGIWADTARLKKTVVHNDYANEPTKKGVPEGHFTIIRHMSTPVIDAGVVKMIVGVGNKRTLYTKEDEMQLQAIANDIEKLIMRKRAEEELQEQKSNLEAIFDTALEGIALLDMETKYLHFNYKYLELLEYTKEELEEKYCYELTAPKYLDEFKEIYKKVLKDGYYENFERECITKSGSIKILKSSIALMPNKNQLLMTTVDFTELRNAYNLIEKQSFIDELTKAENRKSYTKRLKEMLSLYRRYKSIFSMVMLDIDFFKSINDTYGHSVGDDVLVELTQLVQSHIRATDYFFRVGGEEFVILLAQTNLKNAVIVAENLRIRVENNLDTVEEKITISLGVTEVEESDSADSIFKRADEYLYQAKNSGRNRVVSSAFGTKNSKD